MFGPDRTYDLEEKQRRQEKERGERKGGEKRGKGEYRTGEFIRGEDGLGLGAVIEGRTTFDFVLNGTV